MVPAEGRIKPNNSLSSVLFPAPLGPRTATNSPSLIARETFSRMVCPPRRICICSNSMTDAVLTKIFASCFPIPSLDRAFTTGDHHHNLLQFITRCIHKLFCGTTRIWEERWLVLALLHRPYEG